MKIAGPISITAYYLVALATFFLSDTYYVASQTFVHRIPGKDCIYHAFIYHTVFLHQFRTMCVDSFILSTFKV